MAQVRVISKLGAAFEFVGRWSARARSLPQEASMAPKGKIATVHQVGAETRVTASMRGALAHKTGLPPPPVGKALIIPARPIVASRRMARRVALDYAKHVATGKPRQTQAIMTEEALRQLDAGGTPAWPESKSWGRWTNATPPLGGAGGTVGRGWSSPAYRESA